MLVYFLNSFIAIFAKKFATKLVPYFPSHLRSVAALPCSYQLN